MSVLDDLQGIIDPTERSRIKAAAFAQLGSLVGQSILRGNFRLTLTDGPKIVNHMLVFSIRINRIDNGNNVTPQNLNPVMVVNPPILVADPSGPIDLGTKGKFRLDIQAALFQIIRDLRG